MRGISREKKHGQCGRRRLAVGRRGQGQDRRLAVGAGRRRRALPGRPQCRPYAGHRRQVYKLSLLPSGVVRQGKLSIIGNGVVFDPHAFVAEIAKLKAQGVEVTPDRLKIAENAALILSLHRELDGFREDAAPIPERRSARRGAASARPMRTRSGRRAIRVMDLGGSGNAAPEDRPAADAPQCAAPRARPCRSRRMRRSCAS